MILNERLKILRDQHSPKLSQKALCKKIGLNRSTYARYETGANEPDCRTLIKIADFFNVTVDYLLGCSNEKWILNEEFNDENLESALRGALHLSDESKQQIIDFINFLKEKENKKLSKEEF
ncbi:helix-turn-helix transcriptional regulator [Clostridium sporogenes]|uniref:helix-turn-helix domain-containing protein n=1 Tax=Clostridium sporogenes TaxID=1509 RepID=UPI0013D330BD|nr:helix-turn-helix transcriptional regulator [Clostridium sporogenes]NFT30600.1 helix-turn-helix transcriptional regulator [Clostridium sporogenes]